MFLSCNVELPVASTLIVHESSDTEKPPSPGSDRRKSSESEAILRQHRLYRPELVDVVVPGTTRVGKHWV
jgi:hypothetical protein